MKAEQGADGRGVEYLLVVEWAGPQAEAQWMMALEYQ